MADDGDKLRDGPCAEPYSALEDCAAEKGVRSHREKMLRCPRQTDVLIKCMKKNPLYFHAESGK